MNHLSRSPEPTQASSPGLSARALAIDAACDRYEAALRAGERPRIENALDAVPEAQRPRLLRELIALDLELRRDRGESPKADEYRGRFPGQDDVIDAAFSTLKDAPGDLTGDFGDYQLLRVLGSGGMGVVYEARHVSLDRPVALKLMRLDRQSSDGDLRRFRNEATAVASLDHPNIVPILEVGRHEGLAYFSMKLLAGGSLAPRLGDYATDQRSAASLLIVVAEAVHHAHQRGILHRDLKPANILLDEEGRPYVGDFGLAKRLDIESSLTLADSPIGTPAYMAPEQAEGSSTLVTTASDVYGLGAILYALLTGRPPFGEASMMETLRRVRECEPEPPSRFNPRVDRDLETICLTCLQKDPARRYASALALAEDLRCYLADEPIAARPLGMVQHAYKWCRRRKHLVALSAVLLLTATSGLAGILWEWREAVLQRDMARESEKDNKLDLAMDIKSIGLFQQTIRRHAELLRRPDLQALRDDLLEIPLNYSQEFQSNHHQRVGDRSITLQRLCFSYLRASEICRTLGARRQELWALRGAVPLLEQFTRSHPEVKSYREDLARCRRELALGDNVTGPEESVTGLEVSSGDSPSPSDRALAFEEPGAR